MTMVGVAIERADYLRLRRVVWITGLFVTAVVTQGVARPGYDGLHQSISALSLGPAGWVQDLFFVMLGTALLGTVHVWRRILRGGVGEAAYPLLMALTGITLLAAAWWPQDPAPGYDPEGLGLPLPTVTGLWHLAAGGIGTTSAIVAMFVMASRFRRLEAWQDWVLPTRVSAVAVALCVIIYGVWSVQPTGLAGTFERLVFLIPGVWAYAFIARLGEGTPFVLASSQPDARQAA